MLTAKEKATAKTKDSRPKRKAHGKNKMLTAKETFYAIIKFSNQNKNSSQKKKFSRQKQNAHVKNKMLTAIKLRFRIPRHIYFLLPRVFSFSDVLFAFGASHLLLPLAFCFSGEPFVFAMNFLFYCVNIY